jgi:diaminohydroxyphosphoribosylaminopyrimidine deaminase/5-amino-6-(5-phosphoribosylamino)uracil reductase
MRLALDAAKTARGRTSPNPWVGAVVVKAGKVIATAATEAPPGRHAEAAALDAVDARGADIYVTLEPCSPFPGKRTAPCAEALIRAGVRRAFVAMEDPDVGVAGSGITLLRIAGIEVQIGDGAEEARRLLRPYLKHRKTGLPYVIAKFAASLDGKIATANGDSKWITGEAARDLGHQQRAWVDAIMVGSETVLRDNPALTARPGGVLAAHQPVRVVLDSRGRVPAEAQVFRPPANVIVATTEHSKGQWRVQIAATGARLVMCELGERGLRLEQLLPVLAASGIMSVWVEGGATLLGSLFDESYVDEIWAFIAPVVIGGSGLAAIGGEGAGYVADAWRLSDTAIEQVGGDVLVRGYLGEV